MGTGLWAGAFIGGKITAGRIARQGWRRLGTTRIPQLCFGDAQNIGSLSQLLFFVAC
jgi:hypothetical protein